MTKLIDEQRIRASGGTMSLLTRRARTAVGRWLVSIGTRIDGRSGPPRQSADPGLQSEVRTPSNSGDRFANLASMIPGVVYQRIVSPNGDIRYTYISEGARELFGVSPEEVMADPEALFRTYSDDYKAKFRQRLIDASKTLTKWDVEASINGPDGKLLYTHAIAKPERLSDGAVLWTGLILDATRIKQVEEELKAAYRTVEAATKAKSLFLANMSHEIRTPMNGVLGMADLLLKTELQPRQHRLLTTLKNSAQTLLGIINDVLDISRIEAGRFHLECESFVLRQCMEDVIDLCASAAYQKGLELNLIVESALPREVRGDCTRLRQVLINLVGNAVKFTERGDATLRVSAGPAADGKVLVRIEVIDTGIGIDTAAKERLFAPFSQADSSITRRFGGTGLGLAITRHLVDLMGGKVELESEPGNGTCVRVTLPLEVVEGAEEIAPSADTCLGGRILVVDDRPRVREAMVSMLRGLGGKIGVACSEDEARAILLLAADLGMPYSAVIVDRVRPGSENVEFCASIAGDPRLQSLQVVNVVSMNWKGQPGATRQGRRSIVSKPLRLADLLAAIAQGETQLRVPGASPNQAADPFATEEPEIESGLVSVGAHVLLAEDNPVNQEVACEYLSCFGCTVVVVQNGEEAVSATADRDFDIILMDCQMPVLDGLSAARLIREREQKERRPRQVMVAVTANAFESDRQAALEAGMDDYLIKPFSDEQLLELLLKWKPVKAGRKQAVAA